MGDIGQASKREAHAVLSGELPKHHQEPFDRILIAQATLEEQTLVTADPDVRKYDVKTLDANT